MMTLATSVRNTTVWSVTDDPRVIILYDRNVYVIQATEHKMTN